jgi:hypothetical protein
MYLCKFSFFAEDLRVRIFFWLEKIYKFEDSKNLRRAIVSFFYGCVRVAPADS